MCAVLPVVGGRNERNDAMSKEYRAGDRAFAKVGRNLVEVRVKAKAENGWTVETRNGKTLTVKSLESQGGESAATAAPKAAKSKAAKPAVTSTEKGLSLLNAAAAVLEQSDEPLAVRAMIEKAKESGLWTPKGGKTPEQTLYSAIIREIKDKGDAARFRKEGRGLFASAR